jgi:hypothetical protein
VKPTRLNSRIGDNSRDDDVIAIALKDVGVSSRQAHRLAGAYDPELILIQIDLVEQLKAAHDRRVSINPQGFLIRAIEEAYSAPEGYKSPEVRKQEATERQHVEQGIEQAREECQRGYEALLARQPAKRISGTQLTTKTAWEQTLAWLRQAMSGPNFQAWFTQTVLLECKRGELVIGAPSQFHIEWIETRLNPLVRKALSANIG